MHLLTVGMQHFYYTCIVLGIIHSFIKFRKQFGHKFDGYIRFNTLISTPAATASVDEPVESASGDVLPESTPAQNEQISVFPDNEAQKSDLALYTQTLGRFFHSPMQSTKDIPLDYSLSFFLLYQTFERNGEGSSYTQNSNFFWEIPESDILQTADLYLGLSDLSISSITEWPFGDPQNGTCYYSQ